MPVLTGIAVKGEIFKPAMYFDDTQNTFENNT